MKRRDFLIGSALTLVTYALSRAEETVGGTMQTMGLHGPATDKSLGINEATRNLDYHSIDEFGVADDFFSSLHPYPLLGLSAITLTYWLDSGMKFNGIGDIYLKQDNGYIAGARVAKSGGVGLAVKKLFSILPGVSAPNLNVGIESYLDMDNGRLRPRRVELTDYSHEKRKAMVWGQKTEDGDAQAPYAVEDPLSRFSNYVFLDGMDTLRDRIVSLTSKGEVQEAKIETVLDPHTKGNRQFAYKMKMNGGVMGMVEGDVSMNLAKQGRIRLPVNAFADLMGTGVYIKLVDAKTVYA